MSNKKEYHEGKIRSLINLTASLIKSDPTLLNDHDRLRATVLYNAPALKDRTKCPNCEASMAEYVYSFDAWDALLLMAMAQAVKHEVSKGKEFTLANQVRVPDLPVSHAVKCRTTQSSKLGLMAKLKGRNGRAVPGVWVITRRGWEALAGRPVPKYVKVWRGRIEERFDEHITIGQALKSHADYLDTQARKGRKIKEDNRPVIRMYESREWYDFSYHHGAILN